MDLALKRDELIGLVRGFLDRCVSSDELNVFVWDIIDDFTDLNEADRPEPADFEPEFWHAIWRIQHLVAEDSDLMHKEMPAILAYLTRESRLPSHSYGRRPIADIKR